MPGTVDMDLVVIAIGGFAMVVGFPIARAIGRRLEGRSLPSGDLGEIKRRIDEIAQGVDAIAIEVERISEAQRFSTKLLAERPSPPPGTP